MRAVQPIVRGLPASARVQAFDELLLLKRGGRPIYCGPLGKHSEDMVAYFQARMPDQCQESLHA